MNLHQLFNFFNPKFALWLYVTFEFHPIIGKIFAYSFMFTYFREIYKKIGKSKYGATNRNGDCLCVMCKPKMLKFIVIDAANWKFRCTYRQVEYDLRNRWQTIFLCHSEFFLIQEIVKEMFALLTAAFSKWERK